MGEFEIRRTVFGTLEVCLYGPERQLLLVSLPCSDTDAAQVALAQLRSHGCCDRCYLRRMTPLGRHLFELRSDSGETIALSDAFATRLELEAAVAVATKAAATAVLREAGYSN